MRYYVVSASGDPFGDLCMYNKSNYGVDSEHPPFIGWAADGFLLYGRYTSGNPTYKKPNLIGRPVGFSRRFAHALNLKPNFNLKPALQAAKQAATMTLTCVAGMTTVSPPYGSESQACLSSCSSGSRSLLN
jgi:hypothetical protein